MTDLARVLALAVEHDTDYDRRYDLVIEALHLARKRGLAAGIRVDPDEPEWPIVYIELPTGQISWHMLSHRRPWDGHTTEEKFQRIREYISSSSYQPPVYEEGEEEANELSIKQP